MGLRFDGFTASRLLGHAIFPFGFPVQVGPIAQGTESLTTLPHSVPPVYHGDQPRRDATQASAQDSSAPVPWCQWRSRGARIRGLIARPVELHDVLNLQEECWQWPNEPESATPGLSEIAVNPRG